MFIATEGIFAAMDVKVAKAYDLKSQDCQTSFNSVVLKSSLDKQTNLFEFCFRPDVENHKIIFFLKAQSFLYIYTPYLFLQ